MRRFWFVGAAALLGLSLAVPGASGRPEGWSSGSYQTGLVPGRAVIFEASQTAVTFINVGIYIHCAATCPNNPSDTYMARVRVLGSTPISPTGRFQVTAKAEIVNNPGTPIPVPLSMEAQLRGKSATGRVQVGGATINGDQYSGGSFSFTASLGGAEDLFRASGDVVFDASPPYGYPGTPIKVSSFSQVAQNIAAAGAATFRTWWSRSVSCTPKSDVETSPIGADGTFSNSRTYRFATPGIYTVCSDMLDASGNSVTPLASLPAPPWPVNPILICPKGTIIEYATVSIGCKRRR